MKVLINDGMHERGKWLLEKAAIEVDDTPIPQNELATRLNGYTGIIIRSATYITSDIMRESPSLKFIGRGGVGLDNIDVQFAEQQGIKVFNTPAASSRSVAELVFGHVLSIARGIHRSNREMPEYGSTDFKQMKKSHSKGIELEGKTLGIIGLGRIGSEAARIGMGLGMKITGFDPYIEEKRIGMDINGQKIYTTLVSDSLNKVLQISDVITLHVPHQQDALIGQEEIKLMKDGVIIVNASRGGVINEEALLEALDSGKILGAGLDVFENEPSPNNHLLRHPSVSLTPHIGASTYSAQEKIAVELANKIIMLKNEFAELH